MKSEGRSVNRALSANFGWRHFLAYAVILLSTDVALAGTSHSSGDQELLFRDTKGVSSDLLWVLEQAKQRTDGRDSYLSVFLTELNVYLGRAPRPKRRNFTKKQAEVEQITIRNPNYWRAVFELKSDRVLLLWLHALLLERQGLFGEAFGWAVLVRQGVFLSELADERWLAWERDLLKESRVGHYYVGQRAAGDDLVFTSSTTDRVPLSLLSGSADGLASGMPFIPRRGEVQPRLWEKVGQYLKSAPESDQRRFVVWQLGGIWPFSPTLERIELIACAGWLAEVGMPAEAMVCVLNAAEQSMRSFKFDYNPLLEKATGLSAVLAEGTISSSTIKNESLFVTDWNSDALWPGGVHPRLAWEKMQLLRRLRFIEPEWRSWRLRSGRIHSQICDSLRILQDHDGLSDLVRQMEREFDAETYIAYWALEAALVDGNPRGISRAQESLFAAEPKANSTSSKSLHAFAYMGRGDWDLAAQKLADLIRIRLENSDWHFAAFESIHAYCVAAFAGEVSPFRESSQVAENLTLPWPRQLAAALSGKLSREDILAKTKGVTDFETVGRECEARFVLAFAPDATPVSRLDDLKAVIATGRTDFIEYRIARHMLRELERDSAAASVDS